MEDKIKLFHYSANEINKLDFNRAYNHPLPPPCLFYAHSDKPQGLWLSIDKENGWEEWCRKESFRIEGLNFKYEVTLKQNANIVILSSIKEVEKFTKNYYHPTNNNLGDLIPSFKYHYINWLKVKNDFQGIYLKSFESAFWMKYHWIYGWDCISACIWDLSCVKSIKLKE